MALTGPLAPNGKQALLGAQIWAEEVNAKGGLLGRKVELVHYDDQSNPLDRAGHLHQAARRRQSRSRRRSVRDQHGGPGHSGRDAKRQGLHRPVCTRRQRPVPLRPVLLDAAVRADAEGILYRRVLPDRSRAESEAANRRHRGRGRRLLAQRGRRRSGEHKEVRLQVACTTGPTRRTRRTSRRSFAPFRRPTPTWW